MKKDIETDLISVIVPIFNVEAYLRPCIESILASTYTTLQIILVNDGSTDHSGEICDEYTRKDTRIEVIHQKNAGLSPARNSGMKAAKGKYISFIDGDDYIHPQMYEVLLEALQEGNYSFSMILGKQVYDNDKSYSIPSAYTKSILTQEIMIKSLFNHIHPQQGIKEVQAQVVWNKLYKRELLDNEFFQETGTEDTEFNCRIYQKSCQAVIYRYPHVLLGTTTYEYHTSKGKSPLHRPCRFLLSLLAKHSKRKYSLPGMLFGKAFQDDNQREVSCVKHALPASGTPYSEKTKKANSQRVPEKQTYPLSYKTFTPQFLLHSAPVQRIHETVRDKSTKKIT